MPCVEDTEKRRGIMPALRSVPPSPVYGIPPKEVTDPFAIMNYGATTERVILIKPEPGSISAVSS